MKLSSDLKLRLKSQIRSYLDSQSKVAYVESAVALDDDQKNAITTHFNELKGKEVVFSVNEHLLAGFVVKSGSKVADFTLKNKVTSLFDSIAI